MEFSQLGKYNEWKQSNDFTKVGSTAGFEPINIQVDFNNNNHSPFAGIALNEPSKRGECAIDNDPNSSLYFFCIGLLTPGNQFGNKIPATEHGSSVVFSDEVRLYIKASTGELNVTFVDD